MDSSLFAVEMAMARPRSSLALISAPNITATGTRARSGKVVLSSAGRP
jgi:hypothetical protein